MIMRFSSLILFTALLTGCADDAFPVAPVSGLVTLNGKPLANAHVLFQPQPQQGKFEAGPESVGLTDSEGRYTLSTIEPERNGATIGKHRVSVTIPAEENKYGGGAEAGLTSGVPVYTIPERYRLGTELEVEVPADGNENLELKLTSP